MDSSTETNKFLFGTPLRLGEEPNGLAYHIFNPEGTESILFLHGGGTGAPEWDIVLPHFSKQYHLIVPDLPFHNKSSNIEFENPAEDTGRILRDLVQSKGKNGQAHVVGLSMGAHIGWRLAVQHPEVVNTCFLSGFNLVDWVWVPIKKYIPHVVYAIESSFQWVPSSWMDGIQHTTDITTVHSLENFKRVWALIFGGVDLKGKSWKARTLFVAATKGGLLPTNDTVKDPKELALVGRKENPDTKAVQNRTMRHAWSRQDPKLFAEAVTCWIENTTLPDSFEPLQ